MAIHLAKHGEMRNEPETLKKLEQISVSTLKRLLKKAGRSDAKLSFRKPPRTRRQHLRQVDLVVHCGEDSRGEYIHTIQMVDVTSGWSEQEIVQLELSRSRPHRNVVSQLLPTGIAHSGEGIFR